MSKIKLLLLLISLSIVVSSCERELMAGTYAPYMSTTNIIFLQGNINEGNITINTINEQVFVKGEPHGFNIKRFTSFFDTYKYKTDDMYIEKIERSYDSLLPISALLQEYTLKTSTDFKGTMYMFLNFRSAYQSGNRSSKGNVYRALAYGKALADELKDRGITHMDKAQKKPVGEKEPVKIHGNADPKSIRALMQAAKAVQDPRLLVIERESGTGKVNITVFGEETPRTVAADTVFLWEFSKEELEKLRQFVVKR